DGSGNVTHTHVAWHHKKLAPRRASYVPSPIAHDHHFFVVSDLGYASCLEAATGRLKWMERLGEHHSSSSVAANGLLYFTADDGETFVLKAGPMFQVVSRKALGENCYASRAVRRCQSFIAC